MQSNKAAIAYRDFYDVPRVFIVSHQGVQFLFDCKFDSNMDEYPDRYKVYTFSQLTEKDLDGSWEDLSVHATNYLGEVPVSSVKFDPSLRKTIETGLIEELLRRRMES